MTLGKMDYYISKTVDRLKTRYFSLSRKSGAPHAGLFVGLAGCGNFARYAYVPAFNRKNMPVTISGLFSSNICSSKETAKLLRYKTEVFPSFEALLDSGIRGVILTAPNNTHSEYISKALDAGMDIFSEKPVVNSSAEAVTIRRYLEGKGNVLMVGFNQRYTDRIRKIKSIMENRDLGDVYEVSAFHNQDIAAYIMKSRWLNDAKKSGGGILHNAGIHLVNLLLYFFGPVDGVRARLENRELPEHCGEDTASCEIYFKSGIIGRLEASCINGVRSSYEHFEIKGTKGSVYTDMKTCRIMLKSVNNSTQRDIRCKKEFVIDSIFNELLHFRDCVEKRLKPDTDINDSIDTLKVVEAAHRSSSEGKKVIVEQYPIKNAQNV